MSKHCEVCNRSYADDLDVCPHCAEVVEIGEADVVDLGSASAILLEESSEVVAEPLTISPEGPDSAVDLGMPAVAADPNGSGSRQGGEGSADSVIEWASLVEEGPPSAAPAAASFDDPADADLIAEAAAAPPGAAPPTAPPAIPMALPTEATIALPPADDSEDALAADLEAVRTIFAGDASASFARRGEAEPAADDDSALDLLTPAEAGQDVDLGAAPVEESASQKGMEPDVLEVVDSGVDLASAELEAQVVAEAAPAPPADQEAEAGLEATALLPEGEAAPAARPPAREASDPGIDLSAVEVVEEPARPASESAIDLGGVEVVDAADSGEPAEVQVVDSGIFLDAVESADASSPEKGEKPDARPISDSGIFLDAVQSADASPPAEQGEEAAARPISDSGIDLGAVEPTASDSDPQAGIERNAPAATDSGVDAIAAEVESGLNLEAAPFEVVGDSRSGSGAGASEIVEDESATALTAGQLPSGEEEVDLTEMTAAARAVDSSAVDLGASSATFPAAPAEAPSGDDDMNVTRPYEGTAKSIHGEEEEVSPSEVDLGARHEADSGSNFFEPSESLEEAPAELPVEESLDLAGAEDSGVAVDDDLPSTADVEGPTVLGEEEEVEPPEEADDEPPAPEPPPPEKRRSTAGIWVGGLFLGGVVTACVLLGLWLFKIEPPEAWRGFLGGNTTQPDNKQKADNTTPSPTNDQGPKNPATHGRDQVLKYLRERSLAKAPIKADDPDMAAGMKELEGAQNSSDALFWLGVAREAANDAAHARDAYQKGFDSATDAKSKQRFLDGLNRLSTQPAAKAGDMGRAAPGLDPALLVLIFTGALADPPAPEPPAATADEEAGSKFWEAMNLARQGKFDMAGGAIEALDAAIDRHKGRRFAFLGKAQNPDSDPTEDIFLKSSEQLKAYWELRAKLNSTMLPLAMGNHIDADALVKELNALQKVREDLAAKADPADAVVTAAKDAADKAKKLQEVGAALTGKPDASADDIVTAAKDAANNGNNLQAVGKALAVKPGASADDIVSAAKAVVKDAADRADTLQAVREALAVAKEADAAAVVAKAKDAAKKVQTLQDVRTAVAAKPEADDDAVLAKVAAAKKAADALQTVADALREKNVLGKDEGDAAAVEKVKGLLEDKDIAAVEKRIHDLKEKAEAEYHALKERTDTAIHDLTTERDALKLDKEGLQTKLTNRRSPQEMLPIWLPLLRDPARTDLAEKAVADADHVLQDGEASPADKARAHAVKGIALRDEKDYAGAKGELTLALDKLPKNDDLWALAADRALKEATDPAAYYAARAEEYRLEGRPATAAAMLDEALKAAPGRIDLLAERGTLRLDAALVRGGGRVAENDEDLIAARKDAEAAKGAAALYLLGRIDEALGKFDAAAADYDKALAAHGAPDANEFRYMAAEARSLMLQPHDGPQPDDAVTKAQQLAKQILSVRGAGVPFEARAQAMAVEGLWTEALNSFAAGLYPYISPEHDAVLANVLQGHPALRRPTMMTVADPLAAAKHYAAGLQWYNDRDYANAEKEFVAAVENDGQDARYHYYLGLSRLLQGDRSDAMEDFNQGARLEQQSRPPRAAVSAALERVQGEPRLQLNEVRDRPR